MRLWSKVVGVVGTAVLSAGMGLVGGGTAHAGFDPTPFEIVNGATAKCLSVWEGSYEEWAPIVQEPCTHDPSQMWYWAWNDRYSYLINEQSGLCLEPSHGINSNYIPMVQMQCSPDTVHTQQWLSVQEGPDPRYDGYGLVNTIHQRPSLDGHACVDLADGSTEDGATIQTWQCVRGNVNQIWHFFS